MTLYELRKIVREIKYVQKICIRDMSKIVVSNPKIII